jgi:1-acyl-sn-glycerol-3-phosphate acyltransferase
VLFTGSAFILFFAAGTVLAYVVLPLARLCRRDRAERSRLCRRIVGRSWLYFHDYMRLLGLLQYDPRTIALHLPDGPFVMVANHPTLVDVTALVSVRPDMAIVAKRSVFRSPLVGLLLHNCGHIDAGDGGVFSGVAVIEQAVAHLGEGTPVLIFPEGTRSPPLRVGEMHAGAFQIAARAGVPVVPVFIACDPPTLMRGQPWYDVPERTAEMTVKQLPVIDPPHAGVGALARELRDEYRRQIELAGRERDAR